MKIEKGVTGGEVLDLRSGIVAIEDYLKFELVVSQTPYFSFRWLQLYT
jgi:hypothetical protein